MLGGLRVRGEALVGAPRAQLCEVQQRGRDGGRVGEGAKVPGEGEEVAPVGLRGVEAGFGLGEVAGGEGGGEGLQGFGDEGGGVDGAGELGWEGWEAPVDVLGQAGGWRIF